MRIDDDWDAPRPSLGTRGAFGLSTIHLALAFGSLAVALGLIIAPIAEERVMRQAGTAGIDMTSTGSVGNRGKGVYTVRRSVLQSTPNAICIIHANGVHTGDCR